MLNDHVLPESFKNLNGIELNTIADVCSKLSVFISDQISSFFFSFSFYRASHDSPNCARTQEEKTASAYAAFFSSIFISKKNEFVSYKLHIFYQNRIEWNQRWQKMNVEILISQRTKNSSFTNRQNKVDNKWYMKATAFIDARRICESIICRNSNDSAIVAIFI